MIWAAPGERGVRDDDPATWPPLVHINSVGGGPFAAAGTSPVLAAADDELIGPGRRAPQVPAGGAVAVRFPSQDRANAGYPIEGSYDGPGGYWVNVRSRARGLLALLLFTDVGPDDVPTRLVRGSHLHVAQFLAPYGEAGTSADAESWRPWFCAGRPLTRRQGRDVFLCHPFVMHTATWPHRGTAPRMITQPAVHVRDGFALDGPDPSPVAQAIVAGLAMAEPN
jgi:hypothetical protein